MTVALCLLEHDAVGGSAGGGILLSVRVKVLDGLHTGEGRGALADDDILFVYLNLVDKEAAETAVGAQ